MRCEKIILLVGILSYLLFSSIGNTNAASLGVSPAYYDLHFEPGLSGEYYFNFRSDDPLKKYEIYLEGDLSKYLTLKNDSFVGSGRVDFSLNLPNAIETPGRHDIFVGARQVFTETDATLGAVPSIKGLIAVRVPYPGKYADVTFSVKNANTGEDPGYILTLYSRGEEDITVTPVIEIFDFENKSMGLYTLSTRIVGAGSSTEYKSNLQISEYKPGTYRAVVKVNYGSGEKVAEAEFRLGELEISIVNYTIAVERDKINPFFVEIESSWNDMVENIYAEVSIAGTERYFLTPSTSLDSFETKRLEGYFDTNSMEEDEVQLLIEVHYNDQVTERLVDVSLIDKKFELNYLLIGSIVVIVLLGLLMAWIFLKLKKLEAKSVKRK